MTKTDRLTPPSLLRDVFFEHLAANHGSVNISVRIHADSFRSAMVDGGRFHVFDEILHRAILRAPDANALLPARLIRSPGLGIGHVHRVVLRYKNTARTP